jgi:transcriptional regulator with XRE-family HTH domain
MPGTTVDVAALYAALDGKRQAEGLSWRGLAQMLEITPSTFTRMAQGRRPDVDTFATLLRWLGTPVEAFMEPSVPAVEQKPLEMIGTYLRMDKHLSPSAASALDQLIKVAYDTLADDSDYPDDDLDDG